MKTHIQKWGNSLALRIPSLFAKEAKLEQGALVEITLRNGKLIVTSLHEEFTLAKLLKGVTKQNLHGEIDTGPAVGGENW